MPTPFAKALVFSLILVIALGLILVINADFGAGPAGPQEAGFPGITLGLTAEAQESLQLAGDAFPAEDAGFSAYYRVGTPGNYGLDKDTVDNYIFKPVGSGLTTLKAGPAVLTAMGDNYTVATLPLVNIDQIQTDVNLYYDDQGWVVAYLPKDAPASQIWQAREEDVEDPELTDISNTTLLDAINVVIAEGLNQTAITADDTDLGYYHWHHTDYSSFLMMAVTRGTQGEYPVSFAIPESLKVAEVSATMWISQDVNTTAPCATLTLDKADLIPQKCVKGFYHSTAKLNDFKDSTAHNFKLVQSRSDAGASGALLMLVYSAPRPEAE